MFQMLDRPDELTYRKTGVHPGMLQKIGRFIGNAHAARARWTTPMPVGTKRGEDKRKAAALNWRAAAFLGRKDDAA